METLPIQHHIQFCEHGVECESCCWPWTAAKSHRGYGLTSAKCYGHVETYAHRIMWCYYHECRVPKNKFVTHSCHNPDCCNPTHLELTTKSAHYNRIQQRSKEIRANSPHFGNMKLTPQQVLTILKRGKSGKETQKQIADSIGVTQVNVGYILRGKTWRHLQAEVSQEPVQLLAGRD